MTAAEGHSALLEAILAGSLQAIGVASILLYIGSYLALQLGYVRGNGWLYPALNLVAALGFILSLLDQFNLYAMISEIAWAAISLVGLTRLYLAWRHRFSDEERACAARLVPTLSRSDTRRLLGLGAWRSLAPGEVLTREGQPVSHLIFVADGVCRIEIGGVLVASIGAEALIGELTYRSGAPATATVIVDRPARILAFDCAALQSFLARRPNIATAIEASVAGDLRAKLAETTRSLAENRGKRPLIRRRRTPV